MTARKPPGRKPPPRIFADEDERNLHDDYGRKRVHLSPPPSISEALSRLMSRRGYAQIQTNLAAVELWKQVAGEATARETRPGKISRGVWEIFVRNSVVVQELSFSRSKLLNKLAEVAADQKIRDLKFKVGPVD